MKQGKVWGTTQQILSNPFCEMHAISIKPWMRCSTHKHKQKYNLFYVTAGELFILRFQDGALVDETKLQAGEWTEVVPDQWHEFQTRNQSCEAIELYYPEAIGKVDIIRSNQGGVLERVFPDGKKLPVDDAQAPYED